MRSDGPRVADDAGCCALITVTRKPCVLQPTFSPAQVLADTIVRTVELGVTITEAALKCETTVVWCELRAGGPAGCPGCQATGIYRDRVERRLTDLPVAGHPMVLRVRVPRYRCPTPTCERVIFSRDTSRLASGGASTTRRCARYVLRRLVRRRRSASRRGGVASGGTRLDEPWRARRSRRRTPR